MCRVSGEALHLADGSGQHLTIAIPPDGAAGRWKGRGIRWRFRTDHPALMGGLATLRIVPRHGRLAVIARVRGRDLSGADATHLAVSLQIGDDCWSAFTTTCRARPRETVFRCR